MVREDWPLTKRRSNLFEKHINRKAAYHSTVEDKAFHQFLFAPKMQLLYFLSGFLAATLTAFPVENSKDEVTSKHQDTPRPGLNGLLGTGIGAPKGLGGSKLLGESLLSGTPGGII